MGKEQGGRRKKYSLGVCRSDLVGLDCAFQTFLELTAVMNILTNVLSQLTPPPIVNPLEYDGWEYKWKFLVFRPARESQCWRTRTLNISRKQC